MRAALPPPLSAPVAAALDALERLQAATVTALAPAEYSAKIEDARREIAPALGDLSGPLDVLSAVGTALRYHALAVSAVTAYETRGDLAVIGQDPLVAECRPLTELVARDAAGLGLNPSDPAVVGLIVSTEGTPALRACAGEQIEVARRRAGAPR